MGQGESSLPFMIPSDSMIRSSIGNTPLLHLHNGIFAKLEGHNPGGSVKDRTLSSIVLSMFKNGQLKKKGDTLCLVTSGSAGYSLTHIHKALASIPEFDLNVVIVFPRIYKDKQIPAEVIALDSTTTYDDHRTMIENTTGENMKPGGHLSVLLKDGVFMDVLADTKEIAKREGWVMLDQHYDENSMDGHRSTAMELLEQCPDVTDVVCATGTGATAAGLVKHLPEHVKVHSRPAQSGSIDGLSDVNRYNNFCNTKHLEGYTSDMFSADIAKEALRELNDFKVEAGPSSGATYWLAKQIQAKNADAKIVFICADGRITENVKETPVQQVRRPMKSQGITTKIPPIRGFPFINTNSVYNEPQQTQKLMKCYTNICRY